MHAKKLYLGLYPVKNGMGFTPIHHLKKKKTPLRFMNQADRIF